MRPPRLRCTLFPLTYPPHLLVLPATFGLHLFWQTYPYFRALYVISVRRTKSLLTASFRFHLTIDTLAVRLYASSLPRCVRDFHPLERAHGAQTKNGTITSDSPILYSRLENSSYTDRAAVGNIGVSDTAGRCAGMHDRSISDIDSNMSAVTYNVTRLCR